MSSSNSPNSPGSALTRLGCGLSGGCLVLPVLALLILFILLLWSAFFASLSPTSPAPDGSIATHRQQT